jgi:hypothetical protein
LLPPRKRFPPPPRCWLKICDIDGDGTGTRKLQNCRAPRDADQSKVSVATISVFLRCFPLHSVLLLLHLVYLSRSIMTLCHNCPLEKPHQIPCNDSHD